MYYFEYDQYGIHATLKNISCIAVASEKDATGDNMLTCLLSALLPGIHVPCHPFQDENEYNIALLASLCMHVSIIPNHMPKSLHQSSMYGNVQNTLKSIHAFMV